ncbi:MAG TPA: TolC family protein [Candidatus Angelobacter sp.]|jgi:outer membrane protein TolC|nr:TolC family protein [Candidatus Angelobacter sp.]
MKGVCVSILWVAGVCLYGQTSASTPLASLLDEARRNNPEIRASMHGAQAATHGAKQASALPETQLMVQNLSVGSPKPLAGYTNSDFAYIGLGVAQEFPGPGKRGLRSQVASAQADVMMAQSESVSRIVLEQVKTAYFKLAYLQATLETLQRDDKLLGEIEQITESRYRVGRGNQQEVLKAQLQHTKILQDISMHHREQAESQILLKRMLGRTQDSQDVIPEPLQQRPLPPSLGDLQRQATQGNAEVKTRELALRKTQLQTQLAHKEFSPDFGLQYMYQNTDRKFRDYYMLTFSVTLPNRGRRNAELAEASGMQKAAASELEAEIQRRSAEINEQYVIASTAAEQLRIYREGLIPQADATFRAGLAAYQSNRLEFEPVLSSFRDLLDFQEQYERQLSEYETALARIESLTGVTLP